MKKLGLLFVATLGLSTNIKAIDTIGIYYPSTINSNYDGEFEKEDYSFETKDSGIGIIFKHKSHVMLFVCKLELLYPLST